MILCAMNSAAYESVRSCVFSRAPCPKCALPFHAHSRKWLMYRVAAPSVAAQPCGTDSNLCSVNSPRTRDVLAGGSRESTAESSTLPTVRASGMSSRFGFVRCGATVWLCSVLNILLFGLKCRAIVNAAMNVGFSKCTVHVLQLTRT